MRAKQDAPLVSELLIGWRSSLNVAVLLVVTAQDVGENNLQVVGRLTVAQVVAADGPGNAAASPCLSRTLALAPAFSSSLKRVACGGGTWGVLYARPFSRRRPESGDQKGSPMASSERLPFVVGPAGVGSKIGVASTGKPADLFDLLVNLVHIDRPLGFVATGDRVE